MEHIAIWLLAILYVEAVCEIITTSELFFGFRDWVGNKYPGLPATLVTCGYCLSVWVALTVGFFLPGTISGEWLLDGAVKTFALHRMSNVVHVFIAKIIDREPFQFVIIHADTSNETDRRTETAS